MNFLIIFNFIKDYTVAISLILLIPTGGWGVYKFHKHIKDQRFRTYHDLLDQLVNEQRYPDRKIKLDRQIAIIFELRNFPEYFEVTKRIFEGLKEDWSEGSPRAIKEIDLTLQYINGGLIKRFLRKYFF